MVKKYSQLYLEARSSFLKQEDQQTASLLARNLLCYVSGKTHEQIIADREMYANQDICAAMESAVQRVLDGEPLA
jgi:release factor glutamine methyltransferase